jgi:hypothetical protein
VYGSGTLWVDVSILNPGDVWVGPDGRLYEVLSFQSNTQLTLASTYLGATANTQAYAIMPIGLLPSALAQQVKTTLSTANTALSQTVRFDANQNLTSGQKATARSNIGATAASDVGLGLLSKSVAGGVDVTLNTDEAANLFYEFTGALTANISVVVPNNVRQFFVRNATTGAYTLTVKTSAGTGVVVVQGTRAQLECDGTNVVVTSSVDAAMTGDANGNVGIGTTNPLAKLQVGAFSGTGESLADTIALSSYSTTAQYRILMNHTGSGILGIGTDGIGGMIFGNASTFSGDIQYERMRLSVDGNLGLKTVPPAWNSNAAMFNAGPYSAFGQGRGGTADLVVSWNATVTGTQSVSSTGYTYKGTGDLASAYEQNGSHRWYVAPSGVAGNAIAWSSVMTLDNSGNLLVGPQTGGFHIFSKGTVKDAGQGAFGVAHSDGSIIGVFCPVSGGASYSGSAAALYLAKAGTNSRSINAAGTINASGADYAEYMTKADDCGALAKGQIVGVDGHGQLTDKWANAVSFLVKSTDPSYVGGDKWGSREALGVERPVEPVFAAPAYVGSARPDDLAEGEASTGDRDAALARYEADQIAYADAVQTARSHFDTVTMPAYRAALVDFDARLETARQKVDRVAYCGQVPVNVQGAQPGQYVVPIQDGDGIGGQLVDDDAITFAQYRRAVGVVQNILADGRANIRVKVV